MSRPLSPPPPPPPSSSSPSSLPLGEMVGAPPDERAPAHDSSQATTQACKRYTALPVYRWCLSHDDDVNNTSSKSRQ